MPRSSIRTRPRRGEHPSTLAPDNNLKQEIGYGSPVVKQTPLKTSSTFALHDIFEQVMGCDSPVAKQTPIKTSSTFGPDNTPKQEIGYCSPVAKQTSPKTSTKQTTPKTSRRRSLDRSRPSPIHRRRSRTPTPRSPGPATPEPDPKTLHLDDSPAPPPRTRALEYKCKADLLPTWPLPETMGRTLGISSGSITDQKFKSVGDLVYGKFGKHFMLIRSVTVLNRGNKVEILEELSHLEGEIEITLEYEYHAAVKFAFILFCLILASIVTRTFLDLALQGATVASEYAEVLRELAKSLVDFVWSLIFTAVGILSILSMIKGYLHLTRSQSSHMSREIVLR